MNILAPVVHVRKANEHSSTVCEYYAVRLCRQEPGKEARRMWLSGSVARTGSLGMSRKVQPRRLTMPRRYSRRYRRDHEAVLILVLFMLLIVVLLYFS